MKQLLTSMIDLIFPPSPEAILLRTAKPTRLPQHTVPLCVHQCLCVTEYSEPLVKAAIKENKFSTNPFAAQLLGRVVEQWVVTLDTNSTLFVPIPLSSRREHERGHNQVTTVLQQVSSITINTRLLTKTRHTPPQTTLTRSERRNNLTQAFTYSGKKLPDHIKTVVLVDDVLTTGATMKAARATLAPHLPPHVKLICLALAH